MKVYEKCEKHYLCMVSHENNKDIFIIHYSKKGIVRFRSSLQIYSVSNILKKYGSLKPAIEIFGLIMEILHNLGFELW